MSRSVGQQKKRGARTGEASYSIVLPVARGLPELRVEDIGSDDFFKATHAVSSLDEVHQSVVDVSSLGEEEAAARAELVKEEQLLLAANFTVVALSSGGLNGLPLLQHLLVWEGNGIDTLQHFSVGVTLPVGGGVLLQSDTTKLAEGTNLGDLESLDLARAANVGATTQVNERTIAVHSGGVGLHALIQNTLLELVELEHLEQVLFAHQYVLRDTMAPTALEMVRR